MDPEDCRYTKNHEWVRVEGEVAFVGITSYAQEQLGDIVSVEFPKIGQEFKQGESMALIDSMKTTSDVYAPISCGVLEVNGRLEDAPELVNEDPYGEGWILKVKIKNLAEIEGLMDADAYGNHLKEEGEGA